MRHPVTEPHGWRPRDLADGSWCHRLGEREIAALETALGRAKRSDKPRLQMTRHDFPLGEAAGVIDRVHAATEEGMGFQLLRGFPVERYEPEDARLLFWGLGAHMGVARPQGKTSLTLADVRDAGVDYRSATGRGYTSNAQLDYHSDYCDIVGLMCLRTAKAGGESRITSSVAVHNEILRRRPDLLEVLYQPFHYARQGEEAPDEAPWYRAAIFSQEQGRFSCRYTRNHIRTAQRRGDLPPLSAAQEAALDLMDEVAAEEGMAFAMDFEPGDMQFINNHVILHARTSYEDHEAPEMKRHLLRLWLAVRWSRPLAPAMAEAWKSVAPGSVRGGIRGQAYGREIRAYEAEAAAALGMTLPAGDAAPAAEQ